jgi:hypothetical protein
MRTSVSLPAKRNISTPIRNMMMTIDTIAFLLPARRFPLLILSAEGAQLSPFAVCGRGRFVVE